MKLDFPHGLALDIKEQVQEKHSHTSNSDRSYYTTEEKMYLTFLTFLCWYHYGYPFKVSIEYNAIKHRVILQASCQKQTIINTLKKISYDLPPGIEQDVTMVSDNTELSVDFITTNNSFDVIEEYKRTIIEQMLSTISNQGYKLIKYNYLLKRQQYFMLLPYMCFKWRGIAELSRGITWQPEIADKNTDSKSRRNKGLKLTSVLKQNSSLKLK